MTQKVIFTRGDGVCCVLTPAPKALLTMNIEEIAERDVPNGITWRVAEASVLPSSRIFRNAWTDENPGDTVDVDIEKAKTIHMDSLRRIRDKKLKVLDIETMRGIDVQAEKQILRDMPENIDLSGVTTAEELLSIMPEELV